MRERRDNILLSLSEVFISWPTFWKIVEAVKIEEIPDKIEVLFREGIIRKRTYELLKGINWDRDRKGELSSRGIGYMTYLDDRYPERLRKMKYPPYVIFYIGDLSVASEPTVGIVGSRKASKLGREFTRNEASKIANAGYVIVSGFAHGIDTEAHIGAISSGKTIAVLGTACDDVYPRENLKLYKEILDRGNLVLSPFYNSIRHKFVFHIRNSIISALSDYLVVVEAGSKSGAMITATYAFEIGVPVYAVPGKPWDPSSKGTNRLIKMGAKLYESYEDLGIVENRGQKVLDFGRFDGDLPYGPFTVEDLAYVKNMDIQEAQVLLMELEILGLVKKVGPGVYEKVNNS
ncbi:MAG: DNA-processing protein DprA [Thermosulfidibacteraceae bacterium]|jgi:DNA protecting protein DprA